MKNKIKNAKGITLLALVVTIVIIIILATVTISAVFGDNGLIKKAQEAKDMTSNSIIAEQEAMNKLEQELSEALGENPRATNIYVFLYDDGTLTFGTQNQKIEGKTVLKEYGNIKGKEYSLWIEDDVGKTNTPWFEDVALITKVNFVDEIVPISTTCWLAGCANLTGFQNIENLDTSEVKNMESMFNGCVNLTSIDLSNFDTSNVTGMHVMFANCSSLTSLDLSSFNTSNVTYMDNMFLSCTKLTEINGLEKFNTNKVNKMAGMFARCSSLTSIDLSSFNTSNITNMENMFLYCTNLTTIYVGVNWDLSNVENTTNMFVGCGTSTTTPK